MNENDTWQCRSQDTGRKLLGLWTHICLWLSRRGGNEALLRDLRDGWQEDSIQPSGGQPRMNTNKDYEPVINWIMRSPWIPTLKCVPSSPSPRIFYEISQSRNLTSGWNDSANLVCIQTGNCNSINFSANCDVIMVIETALNDYYPPNVAKCRCYVCLRRTCCRCWGACPGRTAASTPAPRTARDPCARRTSRAPPPRGSGCRPHTWDREYK